MKKTISLIAVLLLLVMTVETAADNRRARARAVRHAKRKMGKPNILVIGSGMDTRAMEL